jgi:tetratricopeptide (TPR) repeat protein
MINHRLTTRGILLNVGFAVLAALVFAPVVPAQPQDPSERQRALELYDANKFTEALPLLEKLANTNPKDVAILSRLGFALYASTAAEKDQAARQKIRERARSVLQRAHALGDNSNLTNMALDALSGPDSSAVPFSNMKSADAAMREGEEAFVRGDMDKAIAAYKRAFEADPQLYDAALYAGDAEYKKAYNSTDPTYRNQHFDAAGLWFSKAISVNANRETAYRYWGDALDAQGKTNDARDRFVEAIVAEPYSRQPYVGLTQWAQRHQVQLGHPKIEPPNSSSTEGGQTTLNIDPRTLNSNDGSNEWLLYNLTRIAWSKTDFAKNYPNEKEYRHSLKEEAAALRMVAEACAKDVKSGKVRALEPSLGLLVKLNEDGFIESYVLFVHPDEGIARDYAAYRNANREKLKRYWLEVAIVPN